MTEKMSSSVNDTDPAIEARRIEGFRRMSPAQKFALVGAMIRNVRQLALAGIRSRQPGISHREAMLTLASMSVDRAVLLRAFGWDPEMVGRSSP
jgi:hypothetical protein